MRRLALTLAVVASVTTACSSGSGRAGVDPTTQPATAVSPSPSIRTLTPLPPPPERPPTGRWFADLRQSSIDLSLGQMQVWVDNDTVHPMRPRSIRYVDPRLGPPIQATRLRLNPAGSERGFPLALPLTPVCDSRATRGELVVRVRGGHIETLKVHDEADVVERYVTARCQALAVAAVAGLSWSDTVEVSGPGAGSVGTLTLLVEPTGNAGRLSIDSITGTPLLTAEKGAVWRPRVTVLGTDAPSRVDLPVVPARCDDHVFMEGGGSTAFRLHLRLDGEPLELLVRMSPTGAAAAIGFAKSSCGKA